MSLTLFSTIIMFVCLFANYSSAFACYKTFDLMTLTFDLWSVRVLTVWNTVCDIATHIVDRITIRSSVMAHLVYELHEARQHVGYIWQVVSWDRLAMHNRCIRLIGIYSSLSQDLWTREEHPCFLGVWAQFARYLFYTTSKSLPAICLWFHK